VGELIEGKVSVQSIRKIRYEDLLGRKQVQLNLKQIGGYLTDKRVMAPGGRTDDGWQRPEDGVQKGKDEKRGERRTEDGGEG